MSVFERIKSEIPSGMVFHTPVKHHKFTVAVKENEVVFWAGTKRRPIRVPRVCWDGIPAFLNSRDWVKIGTNWGKAPIDTLQEYDDRFWSQGKTHSSEANYVAVVLEHLKLTLTHPQALGCYKLKCLKDFYYSALSPHYLPFFLFLY
jgi:hypothetical protein